MPSKEKIIENVLSQCEVCAKHIPKSAALSAEGTDYVWYFCSTDCFTKWQAENPNKELKKKTTIQENPGEQNTG